MPYDVGQRTGARIIQVVLPQLVSELQAYTGDVGTLKKNGFLIKLEEQSISENYVGIVKDCA